MPQNQIIMVVEDDPELRELTQALIEDALHVKTVPAATGMQALQLIEERAPDLILLDIMLPGLDGLTLTRMLKAATATNRIPIVAVTASEDRRAVMDAGCNGFVQKPFETDAFLATVRQHLVRQYQPAHC